MFLTAYWAANKSQGTLFLGMSSVWAYLILSSIEFILTEYKLGGYFTICEKISIRESKYFYIIVLDLHWFIYSRYAKLNSNGYQLTF